MREFRCGDIKMKTKFLEGKYILGVSPEIYSICAASTVAATQNRFNFESVTGSAPCQSVEVDTGSNKQHSFLLQLLDGD